MKYGDCRWVDIERLNKDETVVICPVGSLEQHGHHLPLLTDTFLVSEVAERVERKFVDQVVLTPTLWLGASDHHLDFPGTISVPNTLYIEVLKSMVRCFVNAGFKRILFLNGHGGNIAPGTAAITEMANSACNLEGVMLVFSSYWQIAGPALAAEKHNMQTPQITHACEYETSMMLQVRHDLVMLDQAKADPPVIDSNFFHSEQGGRVTLANKFSRLTRTGAMGRPELGTIEKGESLLSTAADEVSAFVREFLTWTALPILKTVGQS